MPGRYPWKARQVRRFRSQAPFTTRFFGLVAFNGMYSLGPGGHGRHQFSPSTNGTTASRQARINHGVIASPCGAGTR